MKAIKPEQRPGNADNKERPSVIDALPGVFLLRIKNTHKDPQKFINVGT